MRAEFYRDYFEIEDRHWWFEGRRAIFLRLLDRYLPYAGDGERQILDIGCGTGVMLRRLERYGSPTGIEAEEQAVHLCRRRGINNVRLAEAPPLPFPTDRFHLVTALDVLEHVDDDRALLREISRVLRPGGLLLLSVPAYGFLWGLQDEVAHHKRRYVARVVGERVADNGLEIVRLSYFNTILFAPIAIVRLWRRAGLRSPKINSDFEINRWGRLNSALARTLASEGRLLERRDLPFGVSILALAIKPTR